VLGFRRLAADGDRLVTYRGTVETSLDEPGIDRVVFSESIIITKEGTDQVKPARAVRNLLEADVQSHPREIIGAAYFRLAVDQKRGCFREMWTRVATDRSWPIVRTGATYPDDDSGVLLSRELPGTAAQAVEVVRALSLEESSPSARTPHTSLAVARTHGENSGSTSSRNS
jgi:hypothetical protein